MGIETGFAVKHREKLKEPEMYRAVLMNDDYTTMDFVVNILELVFHKSEVEAIMLDVRNRVRAVLWLFIRKILPGQRRRRCTPSPRQTSFRWLVWSSQTHSDVSFWVYECVLRNRSQYDPSI
jgi:hypothetical protein